MQLLDPNTRSGETKVTHDSATVFGALSDDPAAFSRYVNMTECEGNNNSATWTPLGQPGNGQWPSDKVANLSVESLDGDNVVIRLAGSTGSAAGLAAVYKGTRHSERMRGEFTSYATIGKAPQGP